MNKELQSLLTNLEKFIYQSENDTFTLDAHQVHLILDHIANQGEKIKRLNNITDELEKVLNTEVMLRYHSKDDATKNKIFNAGGMLYRDYIIDTLKKLKEELYNGKDNESTSK